MPEKVLPEAEAEGKDFGAWAESEVGVIALRSVSGLQ